MIFDHPTYHGSIVILIAVVIDFCFGEPPNRFHPVAWMGAFIAAGKRLSPRVGVALPFFVGVAIVLAGSSIAAVVGVLLEIASARFDLVLIVIQGVVLKCCFGIRSLATAARAVLMCLHNQDLAGARRALSYHLVSRESSQLNASEISAATIESVSENTNDSVVAPVFFYCIGGLPAVLVYRFVNTCDAMLGYRTPELEWLGKFAAYADDALNWIPARMTTVLLMIASVGLDSGSSWLSAPISGFWVWFSDAGKTSSPNAGQSMATAAGALSVRLEKAGCYELGAKLNEPTENDIERMLRLFRRTTALVVVFAVIVLPLLSILLSEGGI